MFKAHRLFDHSTLGSKVIKKERRLCASSKLSFSAYEKLECFTSHKHKTFFFTSDKHLVRGRSTRTR